MLFLWKTVPEEISLNRLAKVRSPCYLNKKQLLIFVIIIAATVIFSCTIRNYRNSVMQLHETTFGVMRVMRSNIGHYFSHLLFQHWVWGCVPDSLESK